MLEKYHKQRLSKKFIKQYEGLNQTYDLKYDLKNELDVLYLSAFKIALDQKRLIENTYEAVRSDCFDMWDNLEFYERNTLIHTALLPVVSEFKVFDHNGVPIYIPFFDTLLNALYVKEVAILEKPQFFDLYHSFKERLIPLSTYGTEVLSHGFAYLEPIINTKEVLIFFEDTIKVFYKVTEKGLERYPIFIKAEVDHEIVETLANALLEDTQVFEDILIEKDLIKPRCAKKILKLRSKRK